MRPGDRQKRAVTPHGCRTPQASTIELWAKNQPNPVGPNGGCRAALQSLRLLLHSDCHQPSRYCVFPGDIPDSSHSVCREHCSNYLVLRFRFWFWTIPAIPAPNNPGDPMAYSGRPGLVRTGAPVCTPGECPVVRSCSLVHTSR
jgi:hypothetical protein